MSIKESQSALLDDVDLPILFSYSKHDLFVNRLSLRVADGHDFDKGAGGSKRSERGGWSKHFSMEALNMSGALRAGPYELGVSVTTAPAPAIFTKVVTFAPRYVLQNSLNASLVVRQVGQLEQLISLAPSEETRFNWAQYKGDHLMQIALTDQSNYRSPFSGGFRIDEVGETLLRVGDPDEVLEVVTECQRRHTPVTDFSAAHLWPTDFHGEWSDERMERRLKDGVDSVQLPARWEWVEEGWSWSNPSAVERETDHEGWEYAINWDTPFSAKVFALALVRRRRWVRHRRPKVRVGDNVDERTIVIEISLSGPSVLVTLSDGAGRPPPYIINNRCAEALYMQQKGVPLRRRMLVPGSVVPYCWDEPAGKRVVELRSVGARRGSDQSSKQLLRVEVRLDEVGERAPLRWGTKQLLLRVSARGNTRTLTISDVSEHGQAADTEETYLHLLTEVKGIGLSLVRSGVRELAYFCISDLAIELSASSLTNRFGLAIGEIRLDNQAHDAQLPAVLIRSSLINRQHTVMDSGTKKERAPFVQLTIIKKNSKGSAEVGGSAESRRRSANEVTLLGDEHVFPYAAVLIDEFELRIEESFVESLVQFAMQLRFAQPSMVDEHGEHDAFFLQQSERRSSSNRSKRANSKRSFHHRRGSFESADGETSTVRHSRMTGGGGEMPAPAVAVAINWYFQRLKLSPIKVNLTYVHGQRVLNEIFRNKMVIPNLDRAPLVLHGLALEHTFKTPQQLANSIANNYKNALLRQVYKLLLQIDALGNPAGFLRGLGSGVKDFFLLPGEALFKGPENFGKAMVNGTWALTRSVLGGTFKASSQITGGLGRLAGTFSMDADYVEKRQQVQPKPKHVVQGLVTGSAGLGRGVMEGLTGLISAPIEGAQSEGVTGFIKGVGKGVVGAVVKPTAGMFDLATRTAEGIANTFDFLEEARGDPSETDRVRPPRMMHGPEHALRAYSKSEAIAQRVLLQLRDGVYMHEALHMCAAISPAEVVVLTSGRLLLASSTTYRTTRQFPLLAIQAVRTLKERNAIELQLKSGTNRAMTGAPSADRARWWRLFKRASPASKAKTEFSKGPAVSDSPERSGPHKHLNKQASQHHGRVTRFGTWLSAKRLSPFLPSGRASRITPRSSAASSVTAEEPLPRTAKTAKTAIPALRTQDHEIECADEHTCRALVAALVLVLAPEDQRKRVTNKEEVSRSSRGSAHIEKPKLTTTTSNIGSITSLQALERIALEVACGEAAQVSCLSAFSETILEEGVTPHTPHTPFSPMTPMTPMTPMMPRPMTPATPHTPRTPHTPLMDARLANDRQLSVCSTCSAKAIESEARSFEMSHRISSRLKHDMAEMPGVSSQLMPELSNLTPIQVKSIGGPSAARKSLLRARAPSCMPVLMGSSSRKSSRFLQGIDTPPGASGSESGSNQSIRRWSR